MFQSKYSLNSSHIVLKMLFIEIKNDNLKFSVNNQTDIFLRSSIGFLNLNLIFSFYSAII